MKEEKETFRKAYKNIKKQINIVSAYETAWWRLQDAKMKMAYHIDDTARLEEEFMTAYYHAREMGA